MGKAFVFVWFVIVATLCASCASYVVYLPDSTEAEKGFNANHYVVVRETATTPLMLLDCYSRPDGVTWKPSCKPVQ